MLAHGGSHGIGAAAATWLLPVLVAAVLAAGYLAGVVRLRGADAVGAADGRRASCWVPA